MNESEKYREIRAFVAEHQTTLFDVALRGCRGSDDPARDAEERVQDALLKVFRSWEQAKQADPLAFTITVIKRECINAYRAKTAAKRPPQVSTDPQTLAQRLAPALPPARTEDQIDARTGLKSLLGRLPPQLREILIRRFYLDHSVEEVAEAMNMPAGTVKWTTSKAREQARALAQEEGTDDSRGA